MRFQHFSSFDEDEIARHVAQLNRDGLLAVLFVGEAHLDAVPGLITTLNADRAFFIGGVFPNLLHGTTASRTGVLVLGVEALGDARVMPMPTSSTEPMLVGLPGLADVQQHDSPLTVLVLLDAFSPHLHTALDGLYDTYGTAVQYLGGGAGVSTLVQEPVVFGRHGLARNAYAVALLNTGCSLGVAHGWKKLFGPIVVTRTDGIAVTELNWRPAFTVYQELLASAGVSVQPGDDFYETAIAFPFGMNKDGCEDLIRDPIRVTEEGGIIFAAPIPNHSVLYLMSGTSTDLIQAAEQAVVQSHSEQPTVRLVLDCESRRMYLGEQFTEEVTLLQRTATGPMVGVTSYGEVSSIGDGLLEVHNKTIVVAGLSEVSA